MNGATWRVPIDHPAFAGHFPDRPIVPGVVLLDRLLAFVGQPCDIASAKFLNPAGPGETLEFRWRAGTSGAIRFDVVGGARTIASGTLTPRAP